MAQKSQPNGQVALWGGGGRGGSACAKGGFGLQWSGCSVRIRLWPRLAQGCRRPLSIVPMYGASTVRFVITNSTLVPASACCTILFRGGGQANDRRDDPKSLCTKNGPIRSERGGLRLTGGGGVWDPKFCVPEIAQKIFPLQISFFPTVLTLVWGGDPPPYGKKLRTRWMDSRRPSGPCQSRRWSLSL